MRTRSVIATVTVIVVLAAAAAAFALLRPTGAAAAPGGSPLSLTIEGLTPPGQPIHVLSYSWGLSNGTGKNGKLNLQDLNIGKEMDELSPDIVQAVKSQQGFASATLIVSEQTQQGGLMPKFRYDLTGVTIVSDQHSGSEGGGLPFESVSIHANSVDLQNAS